MVIMQIRWITNHRGLDSQGKGKSGCLHRDKEKSTEILSTYTRAYTTIQGVVKIPAMKKSESEGQTE